MSLIGVVSVPIPPPAFVTALEALGLLEEVLEEGLGLEAGLGLELEAGDLLSFRKASNFCFSSSSRRLASNRFAKLPWRLACSDIWFSSLAATAPAENVAMSMSS
jgi:hypothetical protein